MMIDINDILDNQDKNTSILNSISKLEHNSKTHDSNQIIFDKYQAYLKEI